MSVVRYDRNSIYVFNYIIRRINKAVCFKFICILTRRCQNDSEEPCYLEQRGHEPMKTMIINVIE